MLPPAVLNPFWNQAQNTQPTNSLEHSNLWIMFLSLSIHLFIPNPKASKDQKRTSFLCANEIDKYGERIEKYLCYFSASFFQWIFLNYQLNNSLCCNSIPSLKHLCFLRIWLLWFSANDFHSPSHSPHSDCKDP